MDKELEIILTSLKIDRRATRLLSLRNELLSATEDHARQIIEHLNLKEKGHYLGQQEWSESGPYYYIFEAFAWEILHCHDETMERSGRAASLFAVWSSHWSSQWNIAMSYWLLGIACRNNKHVGKAEEELKRAQVVLSKLASLTQRELSYGMQRSCNTHIDNIQQVINNLPWPSVIVPLAKEANLSAKPDDIVRASHLHEEVPKTGRESLLGYQGPIMIIVNQPSITDRLIREYFIREVVRKENPAVIFPLYLPGGSTSDNLFLDENPILAGRTYFMKREMQSNDANVIKSLRNRLHHLKEEERKFPIIVILDIIQKWDEDLESQVRYLVQESSSRKLHIWIHSPLFLIPTDLLPTIGTIAIIQPSRGEAKLLEEHFPSEHHEFESKKDSRGFFIYNKNSGKGWQFVLYPL